MSGGGQVQWVLRWFTGQGQWGLYPSSPPLWVPGGSGRSLLVRERFADLGGPSCLGLRLIGNLRCTSPHTQLRSLGHPRSVLDLLCLTPGLAATGGPQSWPGCGVAE